MLAPILWAPFGATKKPFDFLKLHGVRWSETAAPRHTSSTARPLFLAHVSQFRVIAGAGCGGPGALTSASALAFGPY